MKTILLKKPLNKIYVFSIFIVLFTLNFSCEPENSNFTEQELTLSDKFQDEFKKADKVSVYYGPTQPFGGGVARSAVALKKDGTPISVSLLFSEKAILNLPEEHIEISLELHNKAKHLITDHIDFGWNPEGHEPPGIYDLPHFDIHYYWISVDEQMQIGVSEEVGVKAAILPAPEYRPMTYFPTPGYVPNMGKHWISLASGEFNGNTFDKTLIFGSYDGEFIFNEPMITLNYFMGKSFPETIAIPQPRTYERAGHYPTAYKIAYDAVKKMYSVSLIDFVWYD